MAPSAGIISADLGRRQKSEDDASRIGEWIAVSTPDFDKIVENAMERVFKLLDLPRRSDIAAMNENLQRVADAVESLQRPESSDPSDPEPDER